MRSRRKLETTEYRTYGPPGTGKTTWVVAEASRHAERVGPDQVSICSLTNSAVSEVVDRKIPLDPDNITTLHARCKRALGAPAPAESRVDEFIRDVPEGSKGLPKVRMKLKEAEDEEDDSPLAESVMVGNGISLYERSQILRQRMTPQSEWPSEVKRWHTLWQDWCNQMGISDFTGWLEDAVEVRPLPSQQVIYVDEAQDHTPLQLEVIRRWNCRARVLVGDDDQNLYEWSGAVPKEFFHPPLPEGRETVLNQSYRVPITVRRLANHWIRGVSSRKEKTYLPTPTEGLVSSVDFSMEDMHMGILPPAMDFSDGRVHMIITTCAYMLSPILDLLEAEGIHYHNPFRPSARMWNPLGSVSKTLDAYLIPSEKGRRWLGEEAHRWAKILQAHDVFLPGKRKAFLEYCEDYPREEVPPEVLRKHMLEGQMRRAISGDLGLLKDYRKMGVPGRWKDGLSLYSNSSGNRSPSVIVGTIHSVKGGEADVVHLFPDLSPMAFREYKDGGIDRVIRLFYVGMTRSREELHLYRPSGDYGIPIL